jgi:hypothetical protein
MRLPKVFQLATSILLVAMLTSCGGATGSSSSSAASDDAFEQERKLKYTKNYCDYVNDLTQSSGFFWQVFYHGTGNMTVRKGDFYAGSWVYRIGEMLRFNELENTPEGDWIMGYAEYFESLDTKFQKSDINPSKEELGKLGALVATLQSQKSGFAKWDACTSEYIPSTQDAEAFLESINSYREFLENPKGKSGSKDR